MNHDQDMAWGAADDRTRNWREIDPRRPEGPIPVECRSASCGTCWVGILGGAEKLSDVAVREGKKIKEFGYIDTTEPKPLIRLACQAKALGAVSIVIPPWNGVFGKYLRSQKQTSEEGRRVVRLQVFAPALRPRGGRALEHRRPLHQVDLAFGTRTLLWSFTAGGDHRRNLHQA